MMMKRSILAIMCCLLLAGCIFDPAFDTSSWDAFQKSSEAVRAKLGNDDLRRLEIALKYLLLESAQRVDGQMLNNVIARENFPTLQVTLARLGPKINGKSAAAIIQDLSIKLDNEISQIEFKDAECRWGVGRRRGWLADLLLAKERLLHQARDRVYGLQWRQGPHLAGFSRRCSDQPQPVHSLGQPGFDSRASRVAWSRAKRSR